jgi:hypothetical protein
MNTLAGEDLDPAPFTLPASIPFTFADGTVSSVPLLDNSIPVISAEAELDYVRLY